MPLDPLSDLRRLLNDFRRIDYDDGILSAYLIESTHHAAASGLLVQTEEFIDAEIGVRSYPLSPRWIQTCAVLHDDVQTFLTLRDQTHVPWYLTLTSPPHELRLSTEAPAGHHLTEDLIIYWFAWIAPDSTTWYIYPATYGELIVSSVPPAQGPGTTLTLEFRSRDRLRWFTALTTIPEVSLTPMHDVRGRLRAAETSPTSLPLVAPEGIDWANPNIPDGPPQAVTIWQQHLWIYPLPDARYQLHHQYYAEPLVDEPGATIPSPFQALPIFGALAQALRSEGRIGPAVSVQTMGDYLIAYLAAVYAPVEEESRDEAHVPRALPLPLQPARPGGRV
jgi:hypothetical protein